MRTCLRRVYAPLTITAPLLRFIIDFRREEPLGVTLNEQLDAAALGKGGGDGGGSNAVGSYVKKCNYRGDS